MPRIETWGNLPGGVRQHLIDRMRDRAISIPDLNRLRLWNESNPEVREGDCYKPIFVSSAIAPPLYVLALKQNPRSDLAYNHVPKLNRPPLLLQTRTAQR